MKRKIAVGGIAFVFILLLGGFSYYLYMVGSTKDIFVQKADIQKPDFLHDKKIAMYFSTTADQDFGGKGASGVVFLDASNKVKAYKMHGLELGSMAESNDALLVQDKKNVMLFGKQFKEFTLDKPQYTGERTGYLKDKNLYFSIYNTGFGSNGGPYHSNVWFGNEKGMKMEDIPHFIQTSGNDGTHITVVTQDIKANTYHVRKVTFPQEDRMEVSDVVELKNENHRAYSAHSNILNDGENYYFILQSYLDDTDQIVLFCVNQHTLVQDQVVLASYQHDRLNSALSPYNTRTSAYLYNGDIYYINGLGEVTVVNTKTKEHNVKFTIEHAPQDGTRHHEQTAFKNDKLYVTRFDPKTKTYSLEMYSLVSGKKIEEIPMKGLEKFVRSFFGKSVYSYDLKVLHDGLDVKKEGGTD